MQLLVLALMLMMSGKNANLKELEPILQSFGGDGAAQAFKQAEELSGVLSAVQSFMPAAPFQNEKPPFPDGDKGGEMKESGTGGYPLAPIANIADERITYCLSRYIALGE